MAVIFRSTSLCASPLTWFPGTPLDEARSSAATVVSPSGDILVFGGNPLGSTNVLKYGGNNVQAITSARVGPGAIALNNGLFFVFGGKCTNAANGVTSSTLSYNPVPSNVDDPNVFSVAPMSTARYDLGYASDAAGYGYAIGGLGNNNRVLASVERYDSVSNVWSSMTSLPAACYLFGAAYDGADTIYTFGGRTNTSSGTETADVLGYSVSNNTWSALAPMPVAIAGGAAIKGSDGKFYVIGGTAGGVVTNLVQVFDPGSSTWSLSTPLPAALTAAGGAVDALGRLVVLGGADSDGVDLTTTWVSQQLNQPDSAPVFVATSPRAAVYQVPYTYTNIVSGNPEPTFQLIGGPAGMTLEFYSGVLSWTPQADQMGTNLVTVQASNFAGATNRTFAIKATGPTPNAPTNLVVTDLEENSVTLAWDPVTPVVGSVSYTVYYRYVIGGKGGSHAYYNPLVAGLASPSVTIGGLAPGSSHTYAVSVSAAYAESPRSQDFTIITLAPQPPTNVTVTALTSTTVTLAWDPPPGPVPASSYEVWGWTDGGVTSAVYGIGITNTTLTITGLVPGTSHEWGVRTRDALGYLSFFAFASGGQFFVNPTPQPATLSGVSLTPDGAFQFTAQMTSPQTTYVQATANLADPASWETIATNPPSSATFTFTDPDTALVPMRFYRVVTQ